MLLCWLLCPLCQVCRHFMEEGACPYGVRCRFIHPTAAAGDAAVAPTAAPAPAPAKPQRSPAGSPPAVAAQQQDNGQVRVAGSALHWPDLSAAWCLASSTSSTFVWVCPFYQLPPSGSAVHCQVLAVVMPVMLHDVHTHFLCSRTRCTPSRLTFCRQQTIPRWARGACQCSSSCRPRLARQACAALQRLPSVRGWRGQGSAMTATLLARLTLPAAWPASWLLMLSWRAPSRAKVTQGALICWLQRLPTPRARQGPCQQPLAVVRLLRVPRQGTGHWGASLRPPAGLVGRAFGGDCHWSPAGGCAAPRRPSCDRAAWWVWGCGVHVGQTLRVCALNTLHPGIFCCAGTPGGCSAST